MPGRKPKPTALKLLQGTARPDRMNPREPKPKPVGARCPRHLDGEARVAWYQLQPELRRLGLLTRLSVHWLEGLCYAIANARKEPSARNLLAMNRLLAEGGLTPSSLTRLSVPDAGESDPLSDARRPGLSGRLLA